MKKSAVAKSLCWFVAIWGVFSLCVFVCSLWHDWHTDEMEWFEKAARILGYALALTTSAFTALSVRQNGIAALSKALYGRRAKIALGASFAAVILLCAHDVLLYMAYGNQLEGTFTMAAFFALDIALLAAYVILYLVLKKRRALGRIRGLLTAITLLWAVYIVADMAGYPAAHLFDWDEAIMKFAMLCNALTFAVMIDTGSCAAPHAKA